ncbi:MAG: hypothetical protein ACQETL_19775 [Bacteroidota bacterium]
MKNKKHKRVEAIEYDEDGNSIFNLGASAANDDWIRAARLKKQGKLEELKKMEETPMVYVDLENDDDNDESKVTKDTKPKNTK